MLNHVSIIRCFRPDKLVLNFQFYKEHQTGSFVPKLIYYRKALFCKIIVLKRKVQSFMPHVSVFAVISPVSVMGQGYTHVA